MTPDAPSMEVAPPPPAQGPEFALQPPTQAEAKNFELQPEQSREGGLFRSIGQWVGEKFSRQTEQHATEPRRVISELSNFDVLEELGNKTDVVNHLKNNGYSDDEISVYMSRLKAERSKMSPAVFEQQQQSRVQAEAVTHTTENRMSPAVRAQQDERRVQTQGAKATAQSRLENTPLTPLRSADAVRSELQAQGKDASTVEAELLKLQNEGKVYSTTPEPHTRLVTETTPAETLKKYSELTGSGFQADIARSAKAELERRAATVTAKEKKPHQRKPKGEAKPTSVSTETPLQPVEAPTTADRAERVKKYTTEALASKNIPRPSETDYKGNKLEYLKAEWAWRGEQAKARLDIENDVQIMVNMEDWEAANKPPNNDPATAEYQNWIARAEEQRMNLEKKYKGEKPEEVQEQTLTPEQVTALLADPTVWEQIKILREAQAQPQEKITPAQQAELDSKKTAAVDTLKKKNKTLAALLQLIFAAAGVTVMAVNSGAKQAQQN